MKQYIIIRLVVHYVLVPFFFLFVLLNVPLSEFLTRPLIRTHEPSQSDAIVILSSGGYTATLPDFGTYVRLKRAVQLYRSGYAKKLICLGGTQVESKDNTVAKTMKRELLFYGIPEDAIEVYDTTTNTYADIVSLYKKIGSNPDYKKLMFVTSAYHTLRVSLILKRLNLESSVVAAVPVGLVARHWHQRLDVLLDVAREYAALIYFKARGYI